LADGCWSLDGELGRSHPSEEPVEAVLLPFQKEMVRMHVMILALPVFSLIAWALFREAYQPITILLLMGIFYLLPKEKDEGRSGGEYKLQRRNQAAR